MLKEKITTKAQCSAAGARAPTAEKTKPKLAVAITRQTLEEERQFNAAIDLFLSEWVRQQLRPQGEPCTKT